MGISISKKYWCFKKDIEVDGEMGISRSRKYEKTKRSDFDKLRCLKNDTEVIDIDDDADDDEALEARGSEKNVEILDGYDGKDSSVVTTGLDEGNLKEESAGKMINSLAVDPVNYKGKMGISVSKKYDESKRSDFDSFRSWKKDIEVIDIDDDGDNEEVEARGCEKNVEILDGLRSYKKNVEIIDIDDNEKSDLLSRNLMEVDGDVEILDGYDNKDSSVATTSLDDGNLKEESVGKMIDLLAVNHTSDSYFYVPLYKKLLGSVEKISDKLKRIPLQIGYNEKCLETNRLFRREKKGEEVKEDVIEEAFVPLTEEEKDEVSRALSKSNWRRVLVTHKSSNIDITGEILQCLRPREWLNDEVINVYLELLKEREKRLPQKFLKCHFFNTFFYKKLISGKGGYNYQSVRRWTSQRKLGYSLLECDKIFVPIHKEIHWCLAVINKKDEEFQYLDSLRGRDINVLKVLARYFVDEVKDKSGKHIDVSSWKHEFVEDLPEQKNGYDCGVFMIKNVDFYSRDIGLCFNQGHMPYFRLRTAKELLRMKAD